MWQESLQDRIGMGPCRILEDCAYKKLRKVDRSIHFTCSKLVFGKPEVILMAFRIIGRVLLTPILLVTFLGYVGAACLAGWALNHNLDSPNAIGNNVTTWMLPFALIACMVGIASTFPGIHHLTVWRPDSLAAAAASALIAWVLTMLAMALVVKELITRGGNRPLRLKILEFFILVLSGLELLYFLTLHTFFRHDSNVGYYKQGGVQMTGPVHGHQHYHHRQHHSEPTIVGHHHGGHVDYGVHTDLKIPQGHVAHPVPVAM